MSHLEHQISLIENQIKHTEFQIQNFIFFVLVGPQKKLLLDVATFFY